MDNITVQSRQTIRDYRFDNVKAFLILCVVIGHLAENLVSYADFSGGTPAYIQVLFKSIYIFHMPVFMIISGRFAKGRIDRRDWPAVINKVVIPYVIAQLVMLLFYSITGYASVSNFSFFNPLFGLWYLFTIAIYQLITPYIARFRWLLPLSIILALALAFIPQRLFGGFQRVINYYPFFLFGYYTATHSFEYCKKAFFRVISLLAFVGLIVFIANFKELAPVSLLTLRRVYSDVAESHALSAPMFLLFLIARYAAGFAFFFFVMGISPCKQHFFSRLGQDSQYVYVLHLFLIVAMRALDTRYGFMDIFGTPILSVLLCLAGIPLAFLLTTPLVKKTTAWMLAPKFDIKKIVRKICDE